MRPRRLPRDWQPRVVHSVPTGSRSWNDAVGAFLRDARARNCSATTINGYNGYLTGPRTRAFVEDYGIRTVADVTPEKIRSFQAELVEAGLSPATAGTFHRVFRNFLGFCAREGYGMPPESLLVSAPFEPVTEPETFSDDDERALVDACESERDKVLIQFMLRTGLRRTEVVNVRVDDIVEGADGAFLRVRQGKGRKDRIVPLDTPHNRFSRKLMRYIKASRLPDCQGPHLWLGEKKVAGHTERTPLSADGLSKLLQRLSEKTRIHTNPHKFRHTFATRSLAAGVDSLVLQRALGHTTLAMVNRYVHFQSSDLIRAWQARTD